jgi:hypothetical protein
MPVVNVAPDIMVRPATTRSDIEAHPKRSLAISDFLRGLSNVEPASAVTSIYWPASLAAP